MTDPEHTDQRYWDDVAVGDPVSGFAMKLGWTSMVLQVSGTQDWNLQHHDLDYVKDYGNPIFYNTGWTSAILSRTLTDWVGTFGWLQRLEFQFRRMNTNETTIRTHGRVTDKRIAEDGQAVIDIELCIENDRDGITTPATAVVVLPRR
jgi:hypothetical protein